MAYSRFCAWENHWLLIGITIMEQPPWLIPHMTVGWVWSTEPQEPDSTYRHLVNGLLRYDQSSFKKKKIVSMFYHRNSECTTVCGIQLFLWITAHIWLSVHIILMTLCGMDRTEEVAPPAVSSILHHGSLGIYTELHEWRHRVTSLLYRCLYALEHYNILHGYRYTNTHSLVKLAKNL